MGFLDKLFKRENDKNPEADFRVTITDILIKVEHPHRKTEQVLWGNIQEIKLINTEEGPWMPDVWLALIGKEDGCLIPQGSEGFDEVYDIVSKYDGFNFENVTHSMRCTDNAEFHLWSKK
jgi:hypothetical protein